MNDDFLKIYDEFKNDIYRLALSYTNNIQDSEDIVQNVFFKYYKNYRKLDCSYIKYWLIKVTINECKNLFLSSWKRKILPLIDNAEKIVLKNNDNDLLEELSKLPKKDRLIIHLYYYENYNLKEIAKLLHISESNAKVRLYRSRNNLKKILEEKNER